MTRPALASEQRGERPVIAFVAHAVHDRGGMERCFAELIRSLHDRYRVVVVARELDEQLRSLVEWRRIRAPSRPALLRFLCFWIAGGLAVRGCHARLVYALGAIVPNRVDVAAVHFCHRGYRARTGRLAPAGVPAVRRLNTAANRLVAIAAERWSYRHGRVRVLAAVSPGAAAEARRHFRGVDVRIVPNGVDSARFRADGRVRRELRERNGISESETVVLFMGGDWERKGLPIAVEALGLLSPELQREVNLWVVGRGDAARLRRLARLHGVERRVTCFGVTAEPERFYAAADVLVLPSEYETFSLVAYEAAAAGVPVVASAVSGVEDLVGSDDAGLLVDLSPEAVSTALARVATDRTLLRTLGEAARRRSEGYTWEAAGESLDRVFAGLLERESRW